MSIQPLSGTDETGTRCPGAGSTLEINGTHDVPISLPGQTGSGPTVPCPAGKDIRDNGDGSRVSRSRDTGNCPQCPEEK